MNKWLTIHTEYKNEGVEIIVACEEADISYNELITWDVKLETAIERLINRIELDVLGLNIKEEDVRINLHRHTDNTSSQTYTFEPLNITIKEVPNLSKEKMLETLIETVWERQLSKRKREQGDRE